MGPWIYHWFWIDFWTPVWPNLVASLIVYVFVFLKLRAIAGLHEEQLKLHRELRELHVRHHREQMEAIQKEPETG